MKRKVILIILSIFPIIVSSQIFDEFGEIPYFIDNEQGTLFQFFPQNRYERADNELLYPVYFSVQLPKFYDFSGQGLNNFVTLWIIDTTSFILMNYYYLGITDKVLHEIPPDEALSFINNDYIAGVTVSKFISYIFYNKEYSLKSYCAYVANMRFIFYNFDKQDAQKVLDSFTIHRWPYKIVR